MINLLHGVPLPQDIISARKSAGLTQTDCADLVGVSRRSWQSWESGLAYMPIASWALFLLATGQHERYEVVAAIKSTPENQGKPLTV